MQQREDRWDVGADVVDRAGEGRERLVRETGGDAWWRLRSSRWIETKE